MNKGYQPKENNGNLNPPNTGSNAVKPDPAPTHLMGWVCPKCGAALSPFVNYCVKCSGGNWEITFDTNSADFFIDPKDFNTTDRDRGLI